MIDLPGPDIENRETCREYVAAGLCPSCGVGPFAVVAIHCYRKHGIDRHQLREILGVYKTTSICDPGHSASRRRLSRRLWTPEVAEKMARSQPRGPGVRSLSTAGVERNRAMALKHRDARIAELRRYGARMTAKALPRYYEFRSGWDAGLSMGELALQFGVDPVTIKAGLRKIGVDPGDGRMRTGRARAAKLASRVQPPHPTPVSRPTAT